MATTQKSPNVITTGKVRLSYAHIFEAKAQQNEDGTEGKSKFGTALLISKKDKYTLDRIETALMAAKELYKTKYGEGKLPAPSKFKMPLHDGDEDKPEDAAYAGHFYLNAYADNRPGIVDLDLNVITDKTKVYSGCYCRVNLTFYPFKGKASGIAVGLNSVQFLEDGEPFGAVSRPDVDFAEEWDDSMAAKPAPATATSTAAKKTAAPVDEDDPEA